MQAPTGSPVILESKMTAKELRRLMPRDSHDVTTARDFVSLGPDLLAPVADEMLRQLSDQASPVAQIYAEFFALHGKAFAEDVAKFLCKRGMEYQKYMIVGWVLPEWSRDAVSRCVHPLVILVTTNSGPFDTDLRSIQLLARHRLAKREWLLGWLDFKRQAFMRLSLLLEEVELGLG